MKLSHGFLKKQALLVSAALLVAFGSLAIPVNLANGFGNAEALEVTNIASPPVAGNAATVTTPATAVTQVHQKPAASKDTMTKPDRLTPLVNTAFRKLGLPYLFGGNDPDKALDCSAFVQYVFANNGIKLPRSSFAQVQTGSSVSRDHLQSGDLVFFATDGPGASHVGIYLGQGQFIHESPPGVQISRLDDNSIYQRAFVEGRRVLPQD